MRATGWVYLASALPHVLHISVSDVRVSGGQRMVQLFGWIHTQQKNESLMSQSLRITHTLNISIILCWILDTHLMKRLKKNLRWVSNGSKCKTYCIIKKIYIIIIVFSTLHKKSF